MKVYKAIITAEFLIEAENVAQASALLSKIKVIGECVGSKRVSKKDRDRLSYTITRLQVTKKIKSNCQQ